MRKIHVLAAALAGVFLALPAFAIPNLSGTTWWNEYECDKAFDFRADSTFLEYDFNGNERTGHWRLDASRFRPDFDPGTLYLDFDGGESVRAPISDYLFVLDYLYSDGESFACKFTPVSD